MSTFDYTLIKGEFYRDEETGSYIRTEAEIVLEEGTHELVRGTPAEMDSFVVHLARDHGLYNTIEDWLFNTETDRYRYNYSNDYGKTAVVYYIYVYYHNKRDRITHSRAKSDRDTDE